LFSASGYIPGHDVDHWLQAEAQLSAITVGGFLPILGTASGCKGDARTL
jgi:hypothetical protein